MNTFRIAFAAVGATLVSGLTALAATAPASAHRDRELPSSTVRSPTQTFDIADYVAHRKELWAASGPQLPKLS